MLVLAETRGRVTQLTLNRDAKRNALSVELARELIDALTTLPADTRAVVLTGAGSCFCAGADLGEDKIGDGFFDAFDELIATLRSLPAPVIAHVNGPAIGAGMMLSMACDMRVLSETASLRIPVGDMAIGVNEWVVTALADLVGGARARLMLFSGAPLDAADAVTCGYGVAGGIDDTWRLAEVVAAKAPLTQRNIKMQFAPDLFTAERRHEATMAPFSSEDIREAARARAEKRVPRFAGS